jgi:DNA gyrase subunit A
MVVRWQAKMSGEDGAVEDEDPELVRHRAQHRLHVVEGLIRAIDLGRSLDDAIESSSDAQDARARLMAEPFGFDELQALHILDLTLSRRTKQARDQLAEEAAALETILDERP